MARIVPNVFTSYDLTPDEQHAGSILNETQKQVLRNLLAEKASARLALKFDLLNPGNFLQEEAYLKGQIELIQYVLEISEIEEAASRTTSDQSE